MSRRSARTVAGLTTALLLPLAVHVTSPGSAALAAPAAEPGAEESALEPAVEQSAVEAAALADVAALRTGFEQRDGADWTTFEEEQAFLAELDRLSNRVVVEEIGRTAQDRPLHLVQMGAPRPASQAEAAEGRTVFFVCTQHGDEPSGREACLTAMRDLAATTDPTLLRQLRNTTILFIPTVNPDGRVADTRENSQGVDINRDHLQLQTAEGQAIARVFRDWRPDVVHDLHEFGERPEVYDRQFIHLWPRNLNVNEDVRALARSLSQDYIAPAVVDAGYTTGIYGLLIAANGDVIAQIAGDEDERILRNMSGLRHSAGLLVEANNDPTTPEEETDPVLINRRRVDTQLVGIRTTLRFVRQQGADLEEATESARLEAIVEGRAANSPVYWNGADNRVPSLEEVTYPQPCGYLLTPEQAAQISLQLDLHGIERTPAGADVFVPMSQPAEPVIPLLLDERADFELVAGRALTCEVAAAQSLL